MPQPNPQRIAQPIALEWGSWLVDRLLDVGGLWGCSDVHFEYMRPEGVPVGETIFGRAHTRELLDSCGVYRRFFDPVRDTIGFQVRPSRMYDIPKRWLYDELVHMYWKGFVTPREKPIVKLDSVSIWEQFVGRYHGGKKEPGAAFYLRGAGMPATVIESGWSTRKDGLASDLRMWLVGGQVNICMLLVWTRHRDKTVSGALIVWRRAENSNGLMPSYPGESYTIFPAPPESDQNIVVSKGELFGRSLPDGVDGNETWSLSIARLRERALIYFISEEGLEPRV